MNVYVMKNFTLREIYFDVAEGETQEAVQAHRKNPNSPVSHWNFTEEEIKWGTIDTDLHEQYARAFIQALRREPPEDDWTVVVGGE